MTKPFKLEFIIRGGEGLSNSELALILREMADKLDVEPREIAGKTIMISSLEDSHAPNQKPVLTIVKH